MGMIPFDPQSPPPDGESVLCRTVFGDWVVAWWDVCCDQFWVEPNEGTGNQKLYHAVKEWCPLPLEGSLAEEAKRAVVEVLDLTKLEDGKVLVVKMGNENWVPAEYDMIELQVMLRDVIKKHHQNRIIVLADRSYEFSVKELGEDKESGQ